MRIQQTSLLRAGYVTTVGLVLGALAFSIHNANAQMMVAKDLASREIPVIRTTSRLEAYVFNGQRALANLILNPEPTAAFALMSHAERIEAAIEDLRKLPIGPVEQEQLENLSRAWADARDAIMRAAEQLPSPDTVPVERKALLDGTAQRLALVSAVATRLADQAIDTYDTAQRQVQAANRAAITINVAVTAAVLAAVAAGAVPLGRALAALETKADRDGLTGVLNKRTLLERLGAAVQRAKARGQPLSLIMIDLDHFKSVNDTYGHQVGDDVLRALAAIITRTVRAGDIVARYGGEEFSVILPRTRLDDAAAVAERIRHAVERHLFVSGNVQLRRTASIGVAEWSPGQSPADLIEAADQALYESKRGGRNRMTVAGRASQATPGQLSAERRE